MPNKINLITGETYNLSELFSGNRRIIIPDLQRDYCWGNIDSKIGPISLAEGFIDTLIRQFEEHPYGKLNLGLLYGYECPSDYVQLCDGQQRITTLFLLLGMLNRWSGDDSYRHYLITDFEFHEDDHEPYLQYSIRESSLYFLSDLVYHFFTNGGSDQFDSVGDIFDHATNSSCSWFYGEYVTDPSIMSMLRCLSTIENKKEEILSENDPARLEKFVEFLVDRLTFIYYDMGSRANGEETFVVINTTGEPLTATENLKPLVVYAKINKDYSDKSLLINKKSLRLPNVWEEMENYFWQHRNTQKYDTADNGFNEFLRWVTLLETYTSNDQVLFKENAKEETSYRFPYEDINIQVIANTFNAFLKFKNKYTDYLGVKIDGTIPGEGDKITQKHLFVFLPLLAYLREHPDENPRNVRRLWEFLRNLIKIDNVSKSVNELLHDVVKIGFTAIDTIDILGMKDDISASILTSEELFKLEIQKQCLDDASRESLEENIWRAQNMNVDCDGQSLFEGAILPLIHWSAKFSLETAKFNVIKFRSYIDALSKILTTSDNDLTRRALLAYGYKGFPYGRSYGWGKNWHLIIEQDSAGFKNFIDEAMSVGLCGIIAISMSEDPIVKYPEILQYSDKKNFPIWGNSGINTCKRSYALPVPVVLAAIMVRLGADIKLWGKGYEGVEFNRRYPDCELNMDSEGRLELRHRKNRINQFQTITISAVERGTKLRYEFDYSISSTPQALSSADLLIEKFLSSPQKVYSKSKTIISRHKKHRLTTKKRCCKQRRR